MKKISFIFALAVMALTWTACDKDKDDVNPVTPPTKTDLLTAHTWKMTGILIDPPIIIEGENGEEIPLTDLFEVLDCFEDNTITFSANNTYSQSEGTNACSDDDDPVSTGTWRFNDNETNIIVDAQTEDEFTATIEVLTDTDFKISQQMSIPEAEWSGKATLTYKK